MSLSVRERGLKPMNNPTDQAEIPEPDPTDESVEARQGEDLQHLKNATARLMELFDTVQIFVTRYNSVDIGTTVVVYGEGNFCARRGQIADWMGLQDFLNTQDA